jgi:hypothetical protein
MKKKGSTRKRLERAEVVSVEPLRGSSIQRPVILLDTPANADWLSKLRERERPRVHMHSASQPPTMTCAACRPATNNGQEDE